MFAVIKTGGKQYRVAKDDVLDIEKLEADEGASITFDEVLMVGDTVGTPTVAGASVSATVERTFKDKKVIVFKKQRRQNHRRKNGHRQTLTRVRITDIAG
ncbi:50S ribosomal protein L21 [Roseospira goensis]|uniref:Large ribosomal subunit protein bL21 n=1 Tax=Roseospira goensis TaxID=391922 RepID=A0A7W6S223_9PROT|nr:50S ribosomal protein L21 [Roseospira goensis]MBB4287466.1 large subunit ribosomal protein L21 [Roseospira goensis]